MAGLHVPLSTLHPRPHRRRCMTRGHRGSLLLRCRAFSSLSSCRFIPALSPRSVHEPQTGLTSPTCRTPPGQKHGHPPDSSRADLPHPGFDATLLSNDTSTAIPENQDCAPSSRSPPDASRAPFPHRSPRRSSANAACGGLPPPSARAATKGQPSSPAQHHVKKLYLQTPLHVRGTRRFSPRIASHNCRGLRFSMLSHAAGGRICLTNCFISYTVRDVAAL